MSPDRPTHETQAADPAADQVLDLTRTAIQPGTTIIEASAGTGKTYTLTGIVLRLILEKRLSVGQILVVTFTNAATEELGGRIRSALRDAYQLFSDSSAVDDHTDPFLADLLAKHGGAEGVEALRRALLDFDELTVATIHGFCKRVLEESAFESGLPFELEFLDNDEGLLMEIARDVWRRLLAGPDLQHAFVGMWISEQNLGPLSFITDYRKWRRHPRTEILPHPQSPATALANLEQAHRRLASRFDRVRLRLALTRLKLRERSELSSPERLKEVLAAAQAFVDQGVEGKIDHAEGVGDGLWALQLLRSSSLEAAVPPGKEKELERLPALTEIDQLFEGFVVFEHALKCVFLERLHHRFSSHKEENASLAFDDLLYRLHDALKDPRHGPRLRRAVSARYQAALIDEFQDTDLIQYEIFKGLFHQNPLVLVGDPKQAIYGFRGADIFAYLLARRDAAFTYTLGQNWRSGGNLVAAVNGLFGDSPHPFVFDEIPFRPVRSAEAVTGRDLQGDQGKALQWMWLPEESSRARAEARIYAHVSQEIVRLLGSGLRLTEGDGRADRDLRPGDIAVLVRTNAQAMDLQESLRRVGVPAVVGRSGDIFQSEEMEELLRLLEAVLDPARGDRLRTACATLAWGDDAAAIHKLQRDDGAFQRLVDRFDGYRELWHLRGFIAMMELLLDEQDVPHRLLSIDGGERRLTNLQHAVEVLHQAIHDRGFGASALIAWARAEAEAQEHDRDAAELRLESDSMAVSLVTVHKSKGLEYEVVFCPFLWQSQAVSPPVSAHLTPEKVVYDCGSDRLDAHLALADAERLAEDLRLTYVALTRAKRRCVVVWGDIGRGGASGLSALAYLLHRRQSDLQSPIIADSGTKAGDGAQAVAQRVAREVDGLRARRSEWLADLQALVGRHTDSMALQVLDFEPESNRRPSQMEASSELKALDFPPAAWQRTVPWRISSFSSLIRDGERESPDHGDPDLPDLDRRPAVREPQDLFAFARGPRAGDCLHQILEQIDFSHHRQPSTRERVAEILQRFRLDREDAHPSAPAGYDPITAVDAMIDRVMTVDLPGLHLPDQGLPDQGFKLSSVTKAQRLVEWQFYAPLADLSPVELSDLFRAHGQGEWVEDYSRRLEYLGRSRLEGFLTGFVDLLFEHDGKWFIVDWKSNHLGDRVEDYGRDAMLRAMIEHHYLLQYHLYTVAAHRYLQSRLPDWSYERDFGGVFYIFLRGAGGEAPDPIGVEPFETGGAGPLEIGGLVEGDSGGGEPIVEPAPLPQPEPPFTGQLSLFGPPAEVSAAPAPPAPKAPAAHQKVTAALEGETWGIFADLPPKALIHALAKRLSGREDRA